MFSFLNMALDNLALPPLMVGKHDDMCLVFIDISKNTALQNFDDESTSVISNSSGDEL
jgi:hypothetical protein